jgi:hypothetical protein
MSVRLTPLALDGPLLVTTIVYVTSLPSSTGSAESAFTSDKSAAGLTMVSSTSTLFSGFKSASKLVTVDVFATAPGRMGVTTMVTVAVAPFASAPSVQVTVPSSWLQLPCVGVAEPNVTPAGSTSISVAAAAASGPPFPTVIVYVSIPPTVTGSGESVLTTERSALNNASVTVVVSM